MIPQRVKLSGFLSYREEQEIRFDESPLWMLTGANGSGKSSIFDAVTFALFGCHRGGSTNAGELINKESNTLSVEFDFTVDHQLYRILRTVRRQKQDKIASTQQVMRFLPRPADPLTGRAMDEWEAIADTNYKSRFDAWVRDKIGLDYETFTASVLLLQGKSEKLLDSTPAGRAGVLARIVDLERYQKLHAKADDRRKELKGELEAIANQLSGIREVADEELTAAELRVEHVEHCREELSRRIDGLVTLELQALRWEEAGKKLAAARAKLDTAEAVLGGAVAIEKEHLRLQELRGVLPAVGVVVTERGRMAESERKSERLTKERDERADNRRVTEHALDQVKKKLASLKKTLAEDESRRERLLARLQELRGVVEQVRHAEEADAEVVRLESERKLLPDNPDASVNQLQADHNRLALLTQHVVHLQQLRHDRGELSRAVAAEEQAKKEEARFVAEGTQAKNELTATEEKAGEAREARARAEQEAASAAALAHQARALADEFKQLSGEKKCRACGQPLTPKHFEEEKKRREHDAKAAERRHRDLVAAAEKAKLRDEELAQQEGEGRKRLQELRDRYKDATAAVRQAALDIQRFAESCRKSYRALPEDLQAKIGRGEPDDWASTAYPEARDIDRFTAETKEADAVKRRLVEAREAARRVGELAAKLESARERLEKATRALPPGDPAEVRKEYADKQAEEKAALEVIAAGKKAIAAAELDVEKTQRDLSAIDLHLTTLTGNLETETQSRKQSSEAIERARKSLPPAWQSLIETAGIADRAKWQDEFDALVANDTEKKFTMLQAARAGLDPLRAEVKQCAEEADAFPPDARRNPEEVKVEIIAARKEQEATNKDLLDAEREKGMLVGYREQRRELDERYKSVDAEFSRYKILAELLGRDRLQRFLVRTAERQIVEHANSVLDRLSDGQLFLKLVGTDDEHTTKALELECANRQTSGSAINVAFLSGSQRFRVAVALALGIGQYASRQHRPIESVIIDEGFGCLDRAGRQVMIQEMQNLRGHLCCIILVSHQEEFAEAFPDVYRFELQDGTTQVSRVLR